MSQISFKSKAWPFSRKGFVGVVEKKEKCELNLLGMKIRNWSRKRCKIIRSVENLSSRGEEVSI